MVPTVVVLQKKEGSARCTPGLIGERIWTSEQEDDRLGVEFVKVKCSRTRIRLPLLLGNDALNVT